MIDKILIDNIEFKAKQTQETYLDLQISNVDSVSLPAFNSVIIEQDTNAPSLAIYNVLYNSGRVNCTVHALGAVYEAFGYIREIRDGYMLLDILPKDIVNKDLKLKDVLLKYSDYFDLYTHGYGAGWNVDRGYVKTVANGGNNNNPASGAKWFMSTYLDNVINGDAPIISLKLKDVLGAIISNARGQSTLTPANIPDDIFINSHLSMYNNLMQEFADLVGNPKIKGYWRLTTPLNNNTWEFVSDFQLSEFDTELVNAGNTTVNLLKLPLRAWWALTGFGLPEKMENYITDFGIIYKLPNGSTRKVSVPNGKNLAVIPLSGRLLSTSSDYQFNYTGSVPCGLYMTVNAAGLYNNEIKPNYTGKTDTKKIQYLNAVIQAYDIKLEPFGNAVDWYWCWRSVKEGDIYVTETDKQKEEEFFFELFAGDVTVSEFLNSLYTHAGYSLKFNPFDVVLEGEPVDYEKPVQVLDYDFIVAKPFDGSARESIFTGTFAVDAITGQITNENIKFGSVYSLKGQTYPVESFRFNTILNFRKKGKLKFTTLQHNLFGEKADKPAFIISKGTFMQLTLKGLATLALTTSYQNNDCYGIKLQDLVNNKTQNLGLHAIVARGGAVAEFEFNGKVEDIKNIMNNAAGLFAVGGLVGIVEEIKGYNPVDGKGILVCRLVNNYVKNNL